MSYPKTDTVSSVYGSFFPFFGLAHPEFAGDESASPLIELASKMVALSFAQETGMPWSNTAIGYVFTWWIPSASLSGAGSDLSPSLGSFR